MNHPSKKKIKRSPALTAAIIFLGVSILVLITMAIFTSFDEVTNRFESGKVDIVLTEPNWKPEKGVGVVPNSILDKNPYIINKEETVNTYVFLEVTMPYIDKDIIIDDNKGVVSRTVGKDDRIPYYKFVATGKKNSKPDIDINEVTTGHYNTNFNYDQKVNSKWYLLPGYPKGNATKKTLTYVYAYVVDSSDSKELEPLLAKGVTQYPLFNKIYVQNIREKRDSNGAVTYPDPTRHYGIDIKAYGIQANYLENGTSTSTDPKKVWKLLKPDYTPES